MQKTTKDRIKDHFIKPLLERVPEDYTGAEWLRHLFGIGIRDIAYYRAKKAGTLPGLYLEKPLKPIQGIRYDFKGGDIFLVRQDSEGGKVHIQPIEAEDVWEMDTLEFEKFRRGYLKRTRPKYL